MRELFFPHYSNIPILVKQESCSFLEIWAFISKSPQTSRCLPMLPSTFGIARTVAFSTRDIFDSLSHKETYCLQTCWWAMINISWTVCCALFFSGEFCLLIAFLPLTGRFLLFGFYRFVYLIYILTAVLELVDQYLFLTTWVLVVYRLIHNTKNGRALLGSKNYELKPLQGRYNFGQIRVIKFAVGK